MDSGIEGACVASSLPFPAVHVRRGFPGLAEVGNPNSAREDHLTIDAESVAVLRSETTQASSERHGAIRACKCRSGGISGGKRFVAIQSSIVRRIPAIR